jgi:ArsR family transcriptional regulator, arsenate/arsenite/antimonite-responsive transcriptional repressor
MRSLEWQVRDVEIADQVSAVARRKRLRLDSSQSAKIVGQRKSPLHNNATTLSDHVTADRDRPSCTPAATARYSLDTIPYFCNYRNMPGKLPADQVARYADMFSAMGTEARLRIMQLLLQAHPQGLVVGEIQQELDIPNSTLSHHLDKLRNEDLVRVTRESTFLRYTANTEALEEILRFLYAECCTRNQAVRPRNIVQITK